MLSELEKSLNLVNMQTKTKYLSYFGNAERPSRLESFGHALREDSKSSLALSIMFAFIAVTLVSFGLSAIEQAILTPEPLNNRLFAAESVLATSNPNQAELTDQSHTLVNIRPDDAFTFILKFTNTGSTTWTKETVYLKSSTTALKFRHDYWPDPYLPASLSEETVAPGNIGTFKFALQAPVNLNNYVGDFLLVNNNVLIQGGRANVTMNVVEDPSAIIVAQPTPVVPVAAAAPISVCSLQLNIASAVTGLDNETCKVAFGLPEQGPDIRVGLFHTEESITITNNNAWQVYDENDTLLASVPAAQSITFFFIKSKKEYVFDYIDRTIRTTKYLKLNNFNDGIFTITSLEDRPSWNQSINYNDFMGNLEIRYNDTRERTWVIETLPLEEYVKGIKETSNSDPLEYLKAMSVAGRTYALYHHNSGRKHASEFYDVDAYYDQVYKGYVVRLIMPKLVEAVEATRGQIATYDNEVIIAAYFSRSDGRTRSYQEVWGSDVPYLISVPTPHTADLDLWGHGVGIDATDARAHVKYDDWTYDQIIKYYYTKVLLEQIY
jgi:hypothetical protein